MELRFEEEQIRPIRTTVNTPMVYSRFDPQDRIPAIVRFVMKTRIVKTEEKARILILCVGIFLICIAAFMLLESGKSPEIVRLQLPR